MNCLEGCKIISSIKNDESLEKVLTLNNKVVFVLYGNILNISKIVKKLKEKNKTVFINIDLIDGFSNKDVITEFIKKETLADGILSSKPSIIKAANKSGLLTIQRIFLIDSFSYFNLTKIVKDSKPDAVEIMPGVMPKVVSWVKKDIIQPVICGGLICHEEDIDSILGVGADAVSTTNINLWSYEYKKQ